MIGRPLAATSAGLALAGLACVGYGTFVESASYRVRRVDVPILGSGAVPVRVLHFSDVHLMPWQRRRLAFLSSLRGLEPDLVICTGDCLSSPDAVAPFRAALGRLLDAPGAFVFGSNDFEGPMFRNPLAYLWTSTAHEERRSTMPTEELRAALASGGWLDLNDRRQIIEVGGTQFDMRGTGDAHESRDHYGAVAGASEPGVVPLGLTHAPYGRILDAMAHDGVRLVFAGHTHGGQVCVPGYGALTTNCDLPKGQAKGLHRHKTLDGQETWVNVSAGVGMSPFASFRFACPPEVTLLTLTARPE